MSNNKNYGVVLGWGGAGVYLYKRMNFFNWRYCLVYLVAGISNGSFYNVILFGHFDYL